MSTTTRKKPFKLTRPIIREFGLAKQIADVLRLELGAPGRVSRDGVCWWACDIADYGGSVPGTRVGRGLTAGVPDLFCLHNGRAFFIEIKAEDGQISPAQMSVGAAIMAAGGQIGVVTSAEACIACLDEWGIPRARRTWGLTP